MPMANMIILDSSFIISYYNLEDQNHEKALELMTKISRGIYGEVIISDYIFDETVTVLLAKLKDLGRVKIIGDKMMRALKYHIDEETFKDTWQLFNVQKQTKLSFTDCSIIALMKNRNINNIATFDEEFKKIKELSIIQ